MPYLRQAAALPYVIPSATTRRTKSKDRREAIHQIRNHRRERRLLGSERTDATPCAECLAI